ncbi:ABC transporter permease [Nocardiopsis alba]|jgi:ABC-2 type transport system permease protein|nr:ABC transporter permease [Nocardiopsis alba]
MSTTTVRTSDRGASGTRTAPSVFAQTLRLTRTEFTLFVRYQTAWLYLLMPMVLFVPLMSMPSAPAFGDYTTTDLSIAAALLGIGLMLGIGHASNVFAARRESLVLKRLRVSGVPRAAIFGGVTLLVLLFTLLLTALVVAVISAMNGTTPADPVLLGVAVLLCTTAMTFVGLLITSLVRNAESAQMFSTLPMLFLLMTGGIFFPLELMPGPVGAVAGLLPVAPAAEMAQAAYTGYDVFGGFEGAEAVGTLELWTASLPSIAVMLVWIVILALAVGRFFKWDPRRP